MYENMNYAELELQRDLMLKANTFVTDDDGHAVFQACIKSLSDEIEKREAKARRMIKAAVGSINILALASILYLCSGCQTASGLGRDITSVSDGFMEQNAKNR